MAPRSRAPVVLADPRNALNLPRRSPAAYGRSAATRCGVRAHNTPTTCCTNAFSQASQRSHELTSGGEIATQACACCRHGSLVVSHQNFRAALAAPSCTNRLATTLCCESVAATIRENRVTTISARRRLLDRCARSLPGANDCDEQSMPPTSLHRHVAPPAMFRDQSRARCAAAMTRTDAFPSWYRHRPPPAARRVRLVVHTKTSSSTTRRRLIGSLAVERWQPTRESGCHRDETCRR